MTSLQPHDLRGVLPAERPAMRAWRRVLAAVESGAPVPHSVHFHGGSATISYVAPQNPDPLSDAAAMARALGLSDGPKGDDATRRWENTQQEWEATGESWSVWAHLPESTPADVSLQPIGTRHPQDPNEGGER